MTRTVAIEELSTDHAGPGDVEELKHKIEARRQYVNARLLTVAHEEVPLQFEKFSWVEYKSAFVAPTLNAGPPMADGMGAQSRIKDTHREREQQLVKHLEGHKAAVKDLAAQKVKRRTPEELREIVRQKEKESLERFAKENKEYWDKVEKKIIDLPDVDQDRELGIADMIQRFATWLKGVIEDALQKFIDKITELIKQGVQAVVDFFDGCISAVSTFFKRLFG